MTTKVKAPPIRAIIFDHIEEDMPLFVELFCPKAKEILSLEALYAQVENPTFFAENDPVYVRIDTLPKKMEWDILQYSTVPITLFFSKSLKSAPSVESHNFSLEKPWERQKRIFQWIDHYCQKQKKTIQKEAFDRLFRLTDGFGLSILRHVEQILLTLSKSQITLEDLEKHHLYELGPNDWEKAKQMLLNPQHSLRPSPLDMLGFISKLRQEVYYNLFSFELEPRATIPPFRKKDLLAQTKEREALGLDYFLGLLPLLLDLEMLAKSASFSETMLFDLLYARLLSHRNLSLI